MGDGGLLRGDSLALIESDVKREAGGPWLLSHHCPSPPHLGEPAGNMWGFPNISPTENQKN